MLCMLCLMMGSKHPGRLQSGSNAPHSNYVLLTQEVQHVVIDNGLVKFAALRKYFTDMRYDLLLPCSIPNHSRLVF